MAQNRDFECLICHSLVRDCRTSSCACAALLCGVWVTENDISTCPLCHTVDVQFTRNLPMQRIADDLNVRCGECDQTHKHSDNHATWGPKVLVECHFKLLDASGSAEGKGWRLTLRRSTLRSAPAGSFF